eukprot:412422_1
MCSMRSIIVLSNSVSLAISHRLWFPDQCRKGHSFCYMLLSWPWRSLMHFVFWKLKKPTACLKIFQAFTMETKRFLWLQAMWVCLEKGRDTTRPKSTAQGAAGECGLQRAQNKWQISTDVLMHVFTFLDIMDYVCNVLLVCREWNVKTMDLFSETEASQFILLRQIVYNSLKCRLRHAHYSSKEDLLFEMETSVSFTLLYTNPCDRTAKKQDAFVFETYPAQPLYFAANKDIQRFSYIYLLHYIYLYEFGGRNIDNLFRMYVLLTRLVFTGSVLAIGFMTQLFYDKYGASLSETHCTEDKCNERFWYCAQVMLNQFYFYHHHHVQHKPLCVTEEIVYSSVKILAAYAVQWKHEGKWMDWITHNPDNAINDILAKANEMFYE